MTTMLPPADDRVWFLVDSAEAPAWSSHGRVIVPGTDRARVW